MGPIGYPGGMRYIPPSMVVNTFLIKIECIRIFSLRIAEV